MVKAKGSLTPEESVAQLGQPSKRVQRTISRLQQQVQELVKSRDYWQEQANHWKREASRHQQPQATPSWPHAGAWPLSLEERHLRRLLAVRVGMHGLYMDDGEASGEEYGVRIDFMRETPAAIEVKIIELNQLRARARETL